MARSATAARRSGAGGLPGHRLDSLLGFRLGRAHRSVRAGWEERLAHLDLSAPQAMVLRAVEESGAPCLRGLARRLDTDPMNVRRLVEHLERMGLVHSVADPDHRQRRAVQLTPTGMSTCEELAELAETWERELGELLGPEGLEQLRALLDRLEGGLAGGPPASSKPTSPSARPTLAPAERPGGRL